MRLFLVVLCLSACGVNALAAAENRDLTPMPRDCVIEGLPYQGLTLLAGSKSIPLRAHMISNGRTITCGMETPESGNDRVVHPGHVGVYASIVSYDYDNSDNTRIIYPRL